MRQQEFIGSDKIKIERKIAELKSDRSKLVTRKGDLEVKMMELKHEVRTSSKQLPEERYKFITEKQLEYRQQILEIEKEMSSMKSEISRLSIVKDEIENDMFTTNSFNNNELLNSLLYLKNKYYDFSLDKTRIPAMRKMTQDFIDDLDKIVELIKK
jgi:chromosome segregation ATPase